MRAWLFACLATAVTTVTAAGCATGSTATGSAATGSADSPKGDTSRFASRAECGKVADHFFTIQLHGTSVDVPQEHLLDGSNLEYRNRFETFVAACSTKWTPRDTECALKAPSFQYVRQCTITEGTTPLVGPRA